MKQKTKLFATFASMCFVAVLAVIGVFAATQTSFSLTGKIGFVAHGVEMTISGTLSGFVLESEQGTATQTRTRTLNNVVFGEGNKATHQTMSFEDSTDPSLGTAVCFTDLVLVDGNIPDIVLTLNFANTSVFPVRAKVMLPTIPSEYPINISANPVGSIIMGANNGTGTLQISFSLTDTENSFEFDVSSLFTAENPLIEFAKFTDLGVMEDNHDLTLANYLPSDTYTLKYEGTQGVLSDYANICTLKNGETYTGLIEQNMAPEQATCIGIYNSSSTKVGDIDFVSTFKHNLGEKLYSFAAISDVHIGYNTAESDFQKALTYFENDPSLKFVANSGDLNVGGSTTRLQTYKTMVETYTTKPVYAVAGNHEASLGYLTNETISAYTGQNLYYSYTEGNDIYIMVGMYDVHPGEQFSTDELVWLYETLEANRDKRCFVFMHLNPRDGSGDAIDFDLEGDMLSNTKGKVFYSLMSHYTNVTWFHGHTHETFQIQEYNSMNNYDNILGCHSVHIPSLSTPKRVDSSGTKLDVNYGGSEGYIVDVYSNHIVLRGRDFANDKFLPIASYYLDTQIDSIDANTYYDDTQIIVNKNSNILKANADWYASTMDKTQITKISFVKNYNPTTYDESWDASISQNNLVMAYRTGTEITVVGNKNGIIANSSSNALFKDFSNLTEIIGLDTINTDNVTTFTGVFSGCTKLASVDISSLNLGLSTKFNGLFKDCTSLVSVRLPNNLSNMNETSVTVNCSQLFEGCTSLTYVEIPKQRTEGKAFYLSSAFKDCSALKVVKFGNMKVSDLTNIFYRCNKLEQVDMSQVNFSTCTTMLNSFTSCSVLSDLKLPTVVNTSKVKSFKNTFNGCKVLALDCSSWDISSCTEYADFNTNAPGVIAPAFN